MGNESPASAPVGVTTNADAQMLYLPMVRR
jgi:hypothetical protein